MKNTGKGKAYQPDRRDFIRTTGAAALGMSLAPGLKAYSAQSKRPNVLLLIVDQMRQPRWFPTDAPLPNFERLKSRGVEFPNHFVSAVPCSPSRACLMTGLHMDQNGVYNNMHPVKQPSLDPGIATMGHMFKAAGYDTPYIGKWHLTQTKQAIKELGLKPYGFDWLDQEQLGMPGLLHDGAYARHAINWLNQPDRRSRPWFLTLSLTNPHDICTYPRLDVPPLLVPDVCDRLPENHDDDLIGKPRCQAEYMTAYAAIGGKINLYDEKPWRQYLDYYYYLNLKIDKLLGKILDALSETGQANNTIVIFTSDHGDMAGSHRLRAKGPCVYVENTNVPLVISWPSHFPEGESADAISQNVDIFPTLAGMIGVEASSKYPYLPGHSLCPVLKDPNNKVSDHVLYSFTSNASLERACRALNIPAVTSPQNIRAIRTEEWVFARYFDPGSDVKEYELYDMKNDPLEMKNLAGDPAYRAVEKEMADRLREAEAKEMSPRKNN